MNLTKRKSNNSSSFFPARIENDISTLQKEMNSLMNNFFGRSDYSSDLMPSSFFSPAMDLKEKDNKYLLDVDVPGMNDSDIDIDLHDHGLTIKGSKKSERETKDADYICVERSQGSFRREIYLDEDVDTENVKAELKNGVLHVELTKKDTGKSNHKKIPIKH